LQQHLHGVQPGDLTVDELKNEPLSQRLAEAQQALQNYPHNPDQDQAKQDAIKAVGKYLQTYAYYRAARAKANNTPLDDPLLSQLTTEQYRVLAKTMGPAESSAAGLAAGATSELDSIFSPKNAQWAKLVDQAMAKEHPTAFGALHAAGGFISPSSIAMMIATDGILNPITERLRPHSWTKG